VKKIAILAPIAVLVVACGTVTSSETLNQTQASSSSITATLPSCANAINWDQASAYMGQQSTIVGPVISATFASSSRGKPTFLNIGKPYPNPGRFTVVIWGYDRDNFPFDPVIQYDKKTVCVTGLIENYKGIAEIVVNTASDIKIVE